MERFSIRVPDVSRTPTSLKVLGNLGELYAVLSLLATAYSVWTLFNPRMHSHAGDMMRRDDLYVRILVGLSATRMILGCLLFAASHACLKTQRWGRKGMNVYAIGHTLLTILGGLFTVLYAWPKMGPALSPTVSGYSQVGLAVTSLLSLGVVVTILVIVNRKVAVDAFNGIFSA